MAEEDSRRPRQSLVAAAAIAAVLAVVAVAFFASRDAGRAGGSGSASGDSQSPTGMTAAPGSQSGTSGGGGDGSPATGTTGTAGSVGSVGGNGAGTGSGGSGGGDAACAYPRQMTGPVIQPAAARPGDQVSVSGPAFAGEPQAFLFLDRARAEMPGPFAKPLKSTTARPAPDCEFDVTFTLPYLPPGQYWLHVLFEPRQLKPEPIAFEVLGT